MLPLWQAMILLSQPPVRPCDEPFTFRVLGMTFWYIKYSPPRSRGRLQLEADPTYKSIRESHGRQPTPTTRASRHNQRA